LALVHKNPDRVPQDSSSTHVTSLHRETYRQFRKFLGMKMRKEVIINAAKSFELGEE
jgi:hypothetical protein